MKTNSPYHWALIADCWLRAKMLQFSQWCNPSYVTSDLIMQPADSFWREKCKIIVMPLEVYLNMMINKCKMESTEHAIFDCVWLLIIPVFKVKCIGREFRVPEDCPGTRLCCWKFSFCPGSWGCPHKQASPEHYCCSIVFSRHKSSQKCWLLSGLMPH